MYEKVFRPALTFAFIELNDLWSPGREEGVEREFGCSPHTCVWIIRAGVGGEHGTAGDVGLIRVLPLNRDLN